MLRFSWDTQSRDGSTCLQMIPCQAWWISEGPLLDYFPMLFGCSRVSCWLVVFFYCCCWFVDLAVAGSVISVGWFCSKVIPGEHISTVFKVFGALDPVFIVGSISPVVIADSFHISSVNTVSQIPDPESSRRLVVSEWSQVSVAFCHSQLRALIGILSMAIFSSAMDGPWLSLTLRSMSCN